jgi:hypothetical protein
MFQVTFYSFSKVLNKGFINVEIHKSIDDAKLRASALHWSIQSVAEMYKFNQRGLGPLLGENI